MRNADSEGWVTARFAVAAVAGLFLAVPVGTTVHLLVVQHEACLEHGGLIHAGPGGGAYRWTPTEAAPPSVKTAAGDPHNHELCLLASSTRDELALAMGEAGEIAPAIADCVFAAAASTSAPGGPVYLLAPKHSPPA